MVVYSEREMLDALDAMGLPYTRIEHPPVFTCGEAALYRHAADGQADGLTAQALETKNLFLRGESGRLYLALTECSRRVDMKALCAALGERRVRFGPEDLLLETLGLTPGSVTILALVNDPDHRVELLVDAACWPAPAYLCHPLVNTATLTLAHDDLLRFLAHTGHAPRVVEMGNSPGGS